MHSWSRNVFQFPKSDRLMILLNAVFGVSIAVILLASQYRSSAKTPVSLLAPHITMETLMINVNNLDAMKQFYINLLGMQSLSQSKSTVTLGFNHHPILSLHNTPTLPYSSTSDPGMDQIAIVFSSRPGLARTLQRILALNPSLYVGGTNRGAVGEAFYVVDPAGNSLELYYDTDPSTWPRTSQGNVEGDSLPIDINQYIQQYAHQEGNLSMKLGHLQIRIGDMATGKQFYLQTIGFYAVPQLGRSNTSLFMSDGYYHHDLVINQAPGYDGDFVQKYLGLQGFSLSVPSMKYINNLEMRLQHAHVPFTTAKNSITFQDPWGFTIIVDSQSPFWWNTFFP